MLTEEEIEVLLRSVFSEGRNCDDELLMKLRQIPLLSLTRAMNAYLTCEEHVVTAVRVLGLATHGREDRTAEEVEVMLHFFTDKLSSLQTLEVAIEAIALLTGDLSSKGPCTYDVFTALLSKFLQSTSLQALPTNIRRLGYDVLCFMVTRETAQWFSIPFLEAVLRSLDEEGEPELVLRALGLHQVIATYASESVMRPLLYEYFESISSYFPVVFSEIPGCKVTRADLQRALSTCMTHPVYSDPCIKFLLSRMSSPSAVVKQESVELLLDIISPASRHITERLCQHIASVIGHIRNEVVRAVTFGSTHSDAYVKDCLRLLGFVSKRAGDSALCSTHSWVEPMTSGALASLSSGPSVCSAYATMFYHLVSADVHCGVSIASHFLPQLLDGVQSSGSESDGAVLIISAILTGLCDAESNSENFSGLQLQDAVKECLEPVRGSLFQLAEKLATSLHVAEVASVCVRCEFLATLMVLAAWLRPWLCDDTALFVCRKLIALSVSRDDEAASNIVKHISRIGRVEGGMLHDALLSMSGNVEPTVAGVLTLYKGLMNSSASMAFMATKSLLELPEALFKTSPADKDVFSLCRYGVSTHGGFSAEDVRCLVMLASRRNSFDSFCYLLDLLPMLPVTLIPSMLHEVGNGRCGVVAIAILSCFSDDVLGVSKNVDEWVTDLLSVVHAAPVSVLGMQGVSAMCARVPHVSRIFLERSEKLCLPTQLAVYAATARGLLCAEDAATGEVCKITEWITSSISSEWAVSCHKDILSAAFFVSRARGECRAITLLQPLVHGVVRGVLPISLELLGVVVRLVREEPFTHVLEWNDVLEFARIISKRPLGGDFVDWFVELLGLALSHIGSKELLVSAFLGTDDFISLILSGASASALQTRCLSLRLLTQVALLADRPPANAEDGCSPAKCAPKVLDQVLNATQVALGDHKRMVRRSAAQCRHQWLKLKMMRKVVVFVDVKSDELCSVIQQQVAKSVAEAEIVFLEGSFACTLNRRGRRMVDSVGTFACFITEKTLDHADVVYAVYYMRLPVLSLTEGRRARVSILETPSSLGVADGGSTIEGRAEAIRRFFAFEPTKSAVIVFEGGDGVGKATQTAYMVKRLGSEGHRVGTIDFPSDIHRYGDLIREILSGKKGGIRDLDPKLFSLLYSLNRFDCLNELRYWMKRGTKVVLDRYYTANYGHQASKLSEDERVDFIRHLELVEVGWFQLPPSDAVIYLDLPPPVALTAMKGDNKREALDIHETANVSYKEDVRRTYMWCCRNMPGWFHVGCCTDEGVRHSREETHELAYGKIKHCISKA